MKKTSFTGFALILLAVRIISAQPAPETAETNIDRDIAAYTQAIALDPNDAVAYHNRGLVYYAMGDYDRAIADYSETIKLTPNNAAAYYHRGFAYENKGDFDRAIADYTQVIRLGPNDPWAYGYRGFAYENKGDFDQSIADYTQAINLDPNYANAYFRRGYVYGEKGDYDMAIADYTQVIKLEPDNAAAYNNRGIAYSDKGEYDRAIADYNQAIRFDPDDALAYRNRDIAYDKKRRYDAAHNATTANTAKKKYSIIDTLYPGIIADIGVIYGSSKTVGFQLNVYGAYFQFIMNPEKEIIVGFTSEYNYVSHQYEYEYNTEQGIDWGMVFGYCSNIFYNKNISISLPLGFGFWTERYDGPQSIYSAEHNTSFLFQIGGRIDLWHFFIMPLYARKFNSGGGENMFTVCFGVSWRQKL